MPSDRPWAVAPGGLVVSVRLTPKGGRDAIEGIAQLADGRQVLKARVGAAPVEGAANAALIRLLSKALGVAAGRVALAAGASGRIKQLRVEGEPAALAARLESLAAGGK